MITIPGVDPIFMWLGFLALVAVFLVLDLGIFNKKQHEITVKEALIWTGVWFGLSMAFNLFIYLEAGREAGLNFLGGYLLEKALSVDNLFVIFLVFMSFKIEKKYQHKILFWGIIGAIILRGTLILVGTSLVQRFHWIFYIFGAFLIYSALSLVFKKDDEYDPHDSWIVKFIHKIVPVARDHKNGKLFVRDKAKFAVTILFVTLIVVEITDVIFAFDSIPAIFGITTDPFIVFTSNIFAILGLRSLYFVIAKVHDLFHYLNYGIATVLVFIGAKMIIMDWVHISTELSLLVIVGILGLSIVASLIFKPKDEPDQKKITKDSKRVKKIIKKKTNKSRSTKK